MKRIAWIGAVVALLAYGLWALTHPTQPTAPATPALPAPTTNPQPEQAGASTPAPASFTPPTPGQVLDANPATGAPATPPPTSAATTAPVRPVDPAQAAPVATITPAAALPRTLTAAPPDWWKPDAVALWFSERYYTLDTAVDTRPGMGPARAAQAATDQLAAELRTAPDTGRPGAQWLALTKGHGWVKATASIVVMADAPADTATTAYRSVQVVEDRHTDTTFGTTTHLLILKLTNQSPGWRVALTREVAG